MLHRHRLLRALKDPYLRDDLGSLIEDRLAEIYARDTSLDPRLAAEVDATFEAKPLKEVLEALGKAAGVTLVSTFAQEQRLTLTMGKVSVGEAMVEIARRVLGKWTRTGQGHFLVSK